MIITFFLCLANLYRTSINYECNSNTLPGTVLKNIKGLQYSYKSQEKKQEPIMLMEAKGKPW